MNFTTFTAPVAAADCFYIHDEPSCSKPKATRIWRSPLRAQNGCRGKTARKRIGGSAYSSGRQKPHGS